MPSSNDRSELLRRAVMALDEMRRRVSDLEQEKLEPIAVIGMACRYPGGIVDVRAYWQLLCDGVDTVSEVPRARWNVDDDYDPNPAALDKVYCRNGAFCNDVDLFDPQFFGISPREAAAMDPQHRLLLETAWEAMEGAGEARERGHDNPTGVFVGITTSDYAQLLRDSRSPEALGPYLMTGNTLNAASGRLAFTFGLTGPAVSVDTACSSSMVALHWACSSLRSGDCRQALACGVNLMLSPEPNITLCRARMLAPDGRSKAFDASADGYGRGEGCGVVLLKRLSAAIADGNPIWAIIRGSGTNQDGPSSGITVPNGASQQELMRRVLAEARLDPSVVGYVEAHGTGTSLGDPIEMDSLVATYGIGHSAERPLLVGTAKTNIGHLEAAAGLAGFIKAVLCVYHGRVPGNLHLKTPSPHIPWDSIPVLVPTGIVDWPANSLPRIAAVDSFGASGTNVHVLVEEPPQRLARLNDFERSHHLLAVSARTRAAHNDLVRAYVDDLRSETETDVGDICFTAAAGRAHFEHRIAVVGSSKSELASKLESAQARQNTQQTDKMADRIGSTNSRPRICFLFTGQGSQYGGMGRELYRTQPAFAEAFDRCRGVFDTESDVSLSDLVFDPNASGKLNHTTYAQPALFALEYALSSLWQSWGIHPDIVLGHSLGEYVAACVAGLFSPEDAMRAVVRRGALMGALPAGGGMLAVLASPAVLRDLLPTAGGISIASTNGPQNTVLAGPLSELHALEPILKSRKLRCRFLEVSHAFHSSLMDPILEPLVTTMQQVRMQAPQIDIISNLSGTFAGAEIKTAEYWASHARGTVRFAEGIATAAARVSLFLEIGPKPVLIGLGEQVAGSAAGWLASLSSKKSQERQMLESLAELYRAGVPIDWRAYDRPFERRFVALPTYPFQRSRYWFRSTKDSVLPATRPVEIADDAARTPPRPAAPEDPNVNEQTPCHTGHLSSLQDCHHRIVWSEQTRKTDEESTTFGRWILLLERGALANNLAQRLREHGHQVDVVYRGTTSLSSVEEGAFLVPADDEQAISALLDRLNSPGRGPLSGVLFGWDCDMDPLNPDREDSLTNSGYLGCGPIIEIVQALSRQATARNAPRLWLLGNTELPEQVSGEPIVSLGQAAFWGLGACIAQEHPECWGGLILLSDDGSHENLRLLCEELEHLSQEDRVLLAGGIRRVARLQRQLPRVSRSWTPRSDAATYLITGGTGGIGLSLARWLASLGARHVLLAGRSQPRDDARTLVAELTAQGCSVELTQVDVCVRSELEGLFAEAQRRGRDIRGVIHAAGILDDSHIAGLTRKRIGTVLAPKVLGAINLCEIASSEALEFLVFFSSIAGVVGSAGQANYAAANSVLDALARKLSAQGKPVSSIAWGPWSGAGMAGRLDQRVRERIAAEGTRLIDPQLGEDALKRVIDSGCAHAVVWSMNWSQLATNLSPQARSAFISDLLPQARRPEADTALLSRLRGATSHERLALLESTVGAAVARVLGYASAAELDPRRGFWELGMDSLLSTELRGQLQLELGVGLPATLAFEHSSVEALTTHLNERLFSTECQTAFTASDSRRQTDEHAGEPIAIIGMACRFPGASVTPERFWETLVSGVDTTSEVPRERWDVDQFYDPTPGAPGKTYTRRGAFVDGLDQFDAAFFGISPREAASMDPQQRFLLTVSWEALENAAVDWARLRESRTGVFVGIGQYDYALAQARHKTPALIDAYAGTGNALCFAAGRIAYVLGLQGPAMAMDTACSSSLVALHQACQSLRAGECDLALVGGVQLMLSPETFIFLSMSRSLSSDGKCKPFDAAADGFGRGEGCGVVVLKRLSEAVRDRDRIWAVVRGSAVNHDGPSSGLTVPNGTAQKNLIKTVLMTAGVEPHQVGYLETHGAGTPLGDPIELRALSEVLCVDRDPSQPLMIGSVKANIGHTEAAAGIAGLIKTALSLNLGVIPPHIFKTPSPHIDWDHISVKLPAQPTPWSQGGRRLAAVSSFGLSGTNAHAILEEPPHQGPARQTDDGERSTHVLCWSAKTETALRSMALRWGAHIEASQELPTADVCFSAATGRAHHTERCAAVVTSQSDMILALREVGQATDCTRSFRGAAPSSGAPKVAFLFTGQGAQYRGMGQELYQSQPTFRKHIDHCAKVLDAELDIPLHDLLFGSSDASPDPLDQTRYSEPALLSLEYALCELFTSWGIRPAIVAGYSVGEYAAACAAGVLGIDDALRLVARRADLMQSLPSGGGMLALLADEVSIRQRVDALQSDVEIASIDSPLHTVVSGTIGALERLLEDCVANGIKGKWLKASHALHSKLMDPILDEFSAAAANVVFARPQLDFPTNLNGMPETERIATPTYWTDQLRHCVQFDKIVQYLSSSDCKIVLEIGPTPTLTAIARQTVSESPQAWLSTLRPQLSDWKRIATTLAQLYTAGVEVDWAGFDADYIRNRVSLPTYPFQTRRHWIEAPVVETQQKERSHPEHGLDGLRPMLDSGDLFELAAAVGARVAFPDESLPVVVRTLDGLLDLHASGIRDEALQRMVYQIEWKGTVAQELFATSDEHDVGQWLILSDRGGVAEGIAQRLVQRGDRCHLVYAAETDRPMLGSVLEISPGRSEHYQALVDWLVPSINDLPLKGIVNFWALDSLSNGGELCDVAIQNCLPQVYLTQMVRSLSKSPQRLLWLVTRGVQPAGEVTVGRAGLAQSTLWGLGRTLCLERPEHWGGIVDLSESTNDSELDSLVALISNGSSRENEIALRGARHFVPRLKQASVATSSGVQLSNRGAYLITGGLGALGLQAARWLASAGAHEILLLARRAPDKRARDTIRLLEALGSRMSVIGCDASNPHELRALLRTRSTAGERIAGVVHAAGVRGYQPFETLVADDIEQVMAAKVRGGWVLHEELSDQELDFFVSYSSISAVWGSKGQAHYSAGNAFLDTLSHYRVVNGLAAQALDWGPWAAGGMTPTEALPQFREMGIRALFPRPSTELVGLLAASGPGQYIVADMEWNKFLPIFEARRPQPFFDSCRGPQTQASLYDADESLRAIVPNSRYVEHLLSMLPDERLDTLRTLVSERAGRCLAMPAEQVDPNQGFFALGMDSIMVMELVEGLRQVTGIRLSVAMVFRHACVEQLAEYVLSLLMASSSALDPALAVTPVSQDDAIGVSNEAELTEEILALDDEELRSFINAEVNAILDED